MCLSQVISEIITPVAEIEKLSINNKMDDDKEYYALISYKREDEKMFEGKKSYLWLATRMGMPTVKDAPGIEIVQTYNLLTQDQIVGMVMKKLI